MKKQILKAFTMSSLVLVCTLAAAVANAHAQARTSYTARIPFEFTVGDKTVPAGEYTIACDQTAEGLVLLRLNEAERDSVMNMTHAIQARAPRAKTVLVFNRYGNQYFLAEMWRAGDLRGRQLSKSSRERAIERELAQRLEPREPSRPDAKPRTVEITALAK